MRYANTSKEKENGVVYTSTEMANYLAHEIITHKPCLDGDVIRVLDPAVGDGELLIAIIKELSLITTAKISAVGYETIVRYAKKLKTDYQLCFRIPQFLL